MATRLGCYAVILLAFFWLWGCEHQPEPATPTPTLSAGSSGEPEIVIQVGSNKRVWTRSELLAHAALREVTLLDRSAYEGQTKSYRAIPLATLFEGLQVPDGHTIEYQTTDGFSSSISPSRLLGSSSEGSVAYLAVEDPGDSPVIMAK